jgi:ADP-heptose:LPS heptosyltransferase
MNLLIIKLGATGDVVRTTPLLHQLSGQITWVTAEKNIALLECVKENVRCFSWQDRRRALDTDYDLAINLEDTLEAAEFLKMAQCREIFGAYADSSNILRYTENFARWFDLSLISVHGKAKADALKFRNRDTYQEMIFEGLGLRFAGETYMLPEPIETGLSGDVAIAADAGPVWPMKKWAYYDELKRQLEDQGMRVNVLPERSSLLEHLADVRNHRCLVGGDSLPMHFALGTATRCVTLFNCTSPWEIYDYDIQRKLVSPLLGKFFYTRGWDERATTAIPVEEVKSAVIAQFEAAEPLPRSPLPSLR